MSGNFRLMSSSGGALRSSLSSSSMAVTASSLSSPSSQASAPASPSATMIFSGSGSSSTGVATKKPRRLWTLHDRSAVNVNLLKANLAQDGCEEAQLNVGKKLLNDLADGSQIAKNENARLAIYWLIKSSEQGNEEATHLLKECLESNRGINCQNIIDVQMCIQTPRNEKLTIKAARLLYEKLSNGEEFITTPQLEARLSQIREARNVSFAADRNSRESSPSHVECGSGNGSPTTPPAYNSRSSLDGIENNSNQVYADSKKLMNRNISLHNSTSSTETPLTRLYGRGVKLVEEDLVKNAIRYNCGDTPSIFIPHSNSLPLGKRFQRWNFRSYGTFSILQLIILVLLWTGFETNLQIGVVVGASILGGWSSYNLLGWIWSQTLFSDWTTLYKSFLREENWSESIAADRLYNKYCRPYLLTNLFVVGILLCFGSSISNHVFNWITVVVALLTLISITTSFSLDKSASVELICFIALQIISHLFGSFISSGPLLDFIRSSLTSNNFENDSLEVYLTDLWSLLESVAQYSNQIIWFVEGLLVAKIFLNAVMLRRKEEISGKALSEMVLMLWIYRIKSTLAALQIWNSQLKFVAFMVFVILVIYFNRSRIKKILIGIGITFVIILITLISLNWAYGIDVIGLKNMTHGLIDLYNSSFIQEPLLKPKVVDLPVAWEEYNLNCHQTAWKENNFAYTQLTCPSKYQDRLVRWNGYVALVQLKNQQRLKKNIKEGPVFEILISMGTSENSGTIDTSLKGYWYNIIPFSYTHANEQAGLRPTISVLISTMTSSTGNSLDEIQTKIINHLLRLRSGDEIGFIGKLRNNIGGILPEIDGEQIQCIRCQVAEYGELNLVQRKQKFFVECPFKYIVRYVEVLVSQACRFWIYLCHIWGQALERFNLYSQTTSSHGNDDNEKQKEE